jgi:hypothetical protein
MEPASGKQCRDDISLGDDLVRAIETVQQLLAMIDPQ